MKISFLTLTLTLTLTLILSFSVFSEEPPKNHIDLENAYSDLIEKHKALNFKFNANKSVFCENLVEEIKSQIDIFNSQTQLLTTMLFKFEQNDAVKINYISQKAAISFFSGGASSLTMLDVASKKLKEIKEKYQSTKCNIRKDKATFDEYLEFADKAHLISERYNLRLTALYETLD